MEHPSRPLPRRPAARRLLPVLVLVLVAAVPLAACGGDDDATSARPSTSVPSDGTSSATSTTTTTTVAAGTVPAQPAEAVWPDAGTSRRFDDPAAAARSFAVDYLGFTDPVVGDFRAGDARSGEVPVRPSATGPETTVLVRRLAPDDSWWVLGAATANLRLEQPAAGATATSPLVVAGTSTAFEGTVDVEVRSDGADAPLVRGFANGGANGDMGPFSTTVEFVAPAPGGGAVVLSTRSMEDGRLWEATVVRVRFGA